MQWAHPERLWLLAMAPISLVFAARAQGRRLRDWADLGHIGRPGGDGSFAWLAAAICLMVALAQPRWGRASQPPLPPGHDVVLVVDVSSSMGVRDAVPDRLGVAVEAAKGFVSILGRAPGGRIAVVAFAGRGVLRCPLTENLGAVVETLRRLEPGDVTPGGTDLGAGLRTAIDAFDDENHDLGRSVIVVSDGEDHAETWPSAVALAADRGVIVHTVAVGDAEEGHPVPVSRAADAEPIARRGSVVLSRRSDAALAATAKATGGEFIPLGLAKADLGRLYDARIEQQTRVKRAAIAASTPADRFPVFLAASVLFCVLALRPAPSRRQIPFPWLLVVAAGTLGAGPVGDTAEVLVAKGRAAYEAGRYEEASRWFSQAKELEPRLAVPCYNLASALYQLGRFEDARTNYTLAKGVAGDASRTKIDYALGNTFAALGDLSAAVLSYDACLASTAKGAPLDEVRRRAAINRRYVLEHSRSASGTTAPGEGRSRRAGQPDRPGPEPDAPSAPAPGSEGERPMDGPSSNRRGAVGAGGGGITPPRTASPEDRFSQVLDNVKDARRRRLETPPSKVASRGVEDW